MQFQRFSTCLVVQDVAKSVSFYKDRLGFTVAYQLPWFASVIRPVEGEPSWDVSFLQRGHALIPEVQRDRATSGLILGVIVADARAELHKLQAAGVPIARELVDEPYGQRHFFCTDPDGILIDVIETIPPDPVWLAANS